MEDKHFAGTVITAEEESKHKRGEDISINVRDKIKEGQRESCKDLY